ncbi:ATP-dependent Clp protease adapter ClpS [Glycomyces harbinensis]|uniref:ATP-dependent Clp protease adapter protein ClpS n=1 Tax=Glycomyces harbinensis TaxID=58114 RepID=A0A1G6UD95_9ACTN|nr:ATP-dependent Clp protease adapter ClpS [Glycomyces harbinensis]SDD39204.1 ATP-dependent Clp protease adaptor protein ClpS [Glycomyces harbinensis]
MPVHPSSVTTLPPRAAAAAPAPTRRAAPAATPAETAEPDRPWVTIVHNDPVNLMSYVSYVFRSYFGFTEARAEQLMLDVHNKGRAVVSNGTREEMERDVQAMHGYGLWATLSQDR